MEKLFRLSSSARGLPNLPEEGERAGGVERLDVHCEDEAVGIKLKNGGQQSKCSGCRWEGIGQ